MAAEKYIVAAKQWSLGFLKETVYQGNVITVDHDKNQISIDGRMFPDTRDMDIAKRQAERFPNNPLIVPFTDADYQRLKFSKVASTVAQPKPKPGENMKIEQSDEDLHDIIDISSTQVSKRKREAEEASRTKVKRDGMPIIKGDESPEERVERIRAEKLAEGKMPIVHDDSLGVSGGSKAAALNAGQKLPSRTEVEANEASVRQQAEARKKQAEAKRVQVIPDNEVNTELQGLVEQAESSNKPFTRIESSMEGDTETAATPSAPVAPASDARMDALESKVNALSDSIGSLVAVLQGQALRQQEPVVRVPVRGKPGRKSAEGEQE